MSVVGLVLVGLLIGLILGGLGAGGAILTVPALVFIAGQHAQDATTSSLVVVGLAALTGVAGQVRAGRVAWRTALGFGAAGVPAAWAGSLLSHVADPDFLMLGFACVMLLAAAGMLSKRLCGEVAQAAAEAPASTRALPDPPPSAAPSGSVSVRIPAAAVTTRHGTRSVPAVVAAGLGVGLLTGFFGVGGGFVIVPALVLILRLPMALAVGTSLVIVATNAATSLVARASGAHFDWAIIVPFALAAVAATVAGRLIADRVPTTRLRQALAVLLVLVAGHTIWQSGSALLPHPDPPTSAFDHGRG
jgi:uncharacterized protein